MLCQVGSAIHLRLERWKVRWLGKLSHAHCDVVTLLTILADSQKDLRQVHEGARAQGEEAPRDLNPLNHQPTSIPSSVFDRSVLVFRLFRLFCTCIHMISTTHWHRRRFLHSIGKNGRTGLYTIAELRQYKLHHVLTRDSRLPNSNRLNAPTEPSAASLPSPSLASTPGAAGRVQDHPLYSTAR